LPGGLNISDIGSAGGTITFFVNVGQLYKPPINLTAEVVENNVLLSWEPPVNAEPIGYNVYRDHNLTPLNANIITETTYVDDSITHEALYTYSVKAVYTMGLSPSTGSAQAIIITPSSGFTSTFENGTSDGWIIINGTQTNKWIAGTATASTGNYSIYISDNNSSTTYSNVASKVHFFRDIIYTSPTQNTLSFDLRGTGEPNCDLLQVYLCETSYIPVAGSTPIGEQLAEYYYEFFWFRNTINLPDLPVNTHKRVVFTWVNDDSQAGPPAPAIDNITFTSGPVSDYDDVPLPLTNALIGNYPNPFNPETVINFSLASDAAVSLHIYNVKGQLVRSLVNEVYKAGAHSVVWNGCDEDGREVGSGVYFYRMSAGGYVAVRKMVLLK